MATKSYVITANDKFESLATNLSMAILILKKCHSNGWQKDFKSYIQMWRDFKRNNILEFYHNSGVMYRIKIFVVPKKV